MIVRNVYLHRYLGYGYMDIVIFTWILDLHVGFRKIVGSMGVSI